MNIDYVTYPNGIDTENYSYDNPRGRLSNITYPDGKSLSFSWNSRGKLTQLTAEEDETETNIMFSYDGMNRISGYNKTITELGSPPQTEEWNFYYGITGIDKATRIENGIQNLTMDFSTDSNGNILSMNYVETGGYHGELFAVSDNSGNIVAWSTILGINNYAAIRDPNNAYIDPIEIYNPNDINVPLGWNGKKGNNITIQQVGTGNDLIFNAGGSGFSITNLWGATDITDSTTTTTDDTTDKDVGDDAEPCGGVGDCDGIWNRPDVASCKDLARCIKVLKDRYGESIDIKITIVIGGYEITYELIYKPKGGVLEGYSRECNPTSDEYIGSITCSAIKAAAKQKGYDIEEDVDRLSRMQEWYWLKGCDENK